MRIFKIEAYSVWMELPGISVIQLRQLSRFVFHSESVNEQVISYSVSASNTVDLPDTLP